MIEVFRTTVADRDMANLIIQKIHLRFPDCVANFDLTDCDRILRVKSAPDIDMEALMFVVKRLGYKIQVLPDEVAFLGVLRQQ